MYKQNSFGRGPRRSSAPAGRPNLSFQGRPGGQRSGGKRRPGERIDLNRFINKAVITEEVEHFKPEHQFQDFKIQPNLKQAIITKGYVDPTPIQDRTIAHILQGVDLVGIANTGTGKTAAFLIPLLNKVLLNPREKVLIIVPTRELAIQIDQELKEFAKGMRIFSVCCVGGMNIGPQISALRHQHNFIIGTPGRLKDLITRKIIALNQLNSVVLDEADRMLDMGFINDMRFVMAGMPKERQTLFFSATVSPDVDRIIKEFLKDPVKISVKTQDTSKNIDQDIVRVNSSKSKIDVLHELLNQKELSKVLIFGRTKHGVEKLSKVLAQRGFKTESIHGNKNHSKRQKALNLFKDDRVQILVATDVAARGLDIADVTHVINYDLPETYDDYVHRIGRTGRGSKKGKALTFIE
ncbi:MAG: DEAD/DEAH box helicase [Parcubacteria group bacterium]|jgi:superfamily II DNA/RNA helicase